MRYKVMVIDDEPQIHTFIRISLAAEGFDYLGAGTLAEANEHLAHFQPHVIILDLGLPDGDGLSFLTQLRQTHKTPVLVLTARDQEDEKVRLLEAGANDYLSKPFTIRELIVRIKVLIRDLVSLEPVDDRVCFGALAMRTSTHQFWVSGEEVVLTKKEFAFLKMLLERPGQLVEQSVLLREVWGQTHVEDTHYLRVLVSQLRKKLNDNADEQKVIRTEPGIGYRLV
ncbi:response regulator transcription factor [Pseudoalteromonas rubra]|uniref:response regulator transcription factor n=1 Tax=Pseudoalteromonas rubra TaxID=43658 RepID=UPI000F771635|nr:response regulator transcription factor [Pseudoalteromonas rubra]